MFFHEHVFIKDPGTTRGTPWHQDQPYYPVNGRQVLLESIIIILFPPPPPLPANFNPPSQWKLLGVGSHVLKIIQNNIIKSACLGQLQSCLNSIK